jgi:hypothetical protein
VTFFFLFIPMPYTFSDRRGVLFRICVVCALGATVAWCYCRRSKRAKEKETQRDGSWNMPFGGLRRD